MARKVGTLLSGKIALQDVQIATNWKGRQVYRRRASKIDQVKSVARTAVNTFMSFTAPRWFAVLTKAQRDAWEEFANLIGSPAREESNLIGQGSHNLISRQKLQSGFNAYINANFLLFTRGLAVPRDDAPIDVPAPAPASALALLMAPGTATLTWVDPDVTAFPPGSEIAVAVHVLVQRRGRVHRQIVFTSPVPSPGTFTTVDLRTGGAFGSPTVPLARFVRGEYRTQMDTVATTGPTVGGVVSPPSEVATAVVV